MSEALQELIQLSRNLEGKPIESTDRARLAALTGKLIEDFTERGELAAHPYARIRTRRAPIATEAGDYIGGRTVLVTGAAGCIGRALCRALAELDPERIVALDGDSVGLEALRERLPRIDTRPVDVGDLSGLQEAWRGTRPQVVFHLAAEREPGRAEKAARRTVLSNVFGTRCVAAIAADYGCERFIHASTGKCRLIYEERIYPATKQLAEFEIRRRAQEHPDTRWACVRFHHVVDNSIVERTFRQQIAAGEPVTVHLPAERRRHGQNAQEAVALLLNAGLLGDAAQIFGSMRQMDYFSVLALALYLIK